MSGVESLLLHVCFKFHSTTPSIPPFVLFLLHTMFKYLRVFNEKKTAISQGVKGECMECYSTKKPEAFRTWNTIKLYQFHCNSFIGCHIMGLKLYFPIFPQPLRPFDLFMPFFALAGLRHNVYLSFFHSHVGCRVCKLSWIKLFFRSI